MTSRPTPPSRYGAPTFELVQALAVRRPDIDWSAHGALIARVIAPWALPVLARGLPERRAEKIAIMAGDVLALLGTRGREGAEAALTAFGFELELESHDAWAIGAARRVLAGEITRADLAPEANALDARVADIDAGLTATSPAARAAVDTRLVELRADLHYLSAGQPPSRRLARVRAAAY